MGGGKVSAIQDGAPSVTEAGDSTSDFVNTLRALKEGQFFVVKGVNRRNLYARLQYAECKHGIYAMMRPIGEDYKVFLRPGRR